MNPIVIVWFVPWNGLYLVKKYYLLVQFVLTSNSKLVFSKHLIDSCENVAVAVMNVFILLRSVYSYRILLISDKGDKTIYCNQRNGVHLFTNRKQWFISNITRNNNLFREIVHFYASHLRSKSAWFVFIRVIIGLLQLECGKGNERTASAATVTPM